ncbi:hypothetical protein [endosymbiont GvMRE of Glomus versiforme]|uniref:hypothetical protein n=1 Tax=endosymbiont GvMRE of Glomus versiforme TaxID=2039283 RepID=UPI001558CA14|nr:hypothetical protein [endosymbiont GvMRE of Glomus versiforme]
MEKKNIPKIQIQMKPYWKGWEKLWQSDSPEKVKGGAMANLFGFRVMLRGNRNKEGLPETREELRKEFYKWIDSTKINSANCPPELKNMLFDFHEVLEGRGEEFAKRQIEESDKELAKWSPEKWQEEMAKGLGTIYENVEKLNDEEKNFEGKNWNEINLASKFNGNAEKGKQTFKQIIQGKSEPSKEQVSEKEKSNVNHPEKQAQNSNFSTSDKEFPWKIVLLISLPIILAIATITIIMRKRKVAGK